MSEVKVNKKHNTGLVKFYGQVKVEVKSLTQVIDKVNINYD